MTINSLCLVTALLVVSSACAKKAEIENCTTDGQIECLTTAEFAAIQVAGAADKIVSGQTLGGVAGTAIVSGSTGGTTSSSSGPLPACTLDGQIT